MKNHKITLIYFISVLFLLLALFVLFIKKEQKKKQFEYLPEFSYREVDGYINSTKYLPLFNNYVVLLFSPSCEACQNEAEIILDNYDSLDQCFFLFLSLDSIDNIEVFMMNHNLYDKNNVFYGQVEIDTIAKKFGRSAFPWSYIYDQNKLLIESGLILSRSDVERYLLK